MSRKKNFNNPQELIDSTNPMLKLLGEAMKEHNEIWEGREVTPQSIMDITGLNRAQLFTAIGGYPSDSQQPLKLERVALFYLFLKAYPGTTFLIENEEKERKWLRENDKKRGTPEWKNPKKLFTRDTWQAIKAGWGDRKVYLDFWDNIYSSSRKKNEDLEDVYNIIAEKYYKKAKQSIIAHELLFKGDNTRPDDYKAYADAQYIILKQIEDQLDQNSDLIYERYFYFSRSEDLPFKLDKSEWYQAFVTEASIVTLSHVYRCLKKFPNQCTFEATTSSSFRHKVIIDERDMLLEDYAVLGNLIVPESICVIDVRRHNETAKMHKLTKKIQTERHFEPLSSTEIEDGIDYVLEHLNRELKTRDRLIEDIKNRRRRDKKYKLLEKELRRQSKVYTNMIDSLARKKALIKMLKDSLTY